MRPHAVPRAALLFAALAVTTGAAPASSSGGAQFTHAGGTLVIATKSYRLALSDRNGRIVQLSDHGSPVLRDTQRCLWGVLGAIDRSYIGGCSFSPGAAHRFSYRWQAASSTLTLTYRAKTFGSVVVTVRARSAFLDLTLELVNRRETATRIRFPDGLSGDVRSVAAGYAPNVLPGVKLAPGFFSRISNDIQIYPSRWAFADYLALDETGGRVALYTVAPGRLHPAQVGFLHAAEPAACSGPVYCVFHEFETWVPQNGTWTSPVVRLRLGASAQASTLAYRHDNGIDAYPSLQTKAGPRFATLASAPLLKANLPLLKPFTQWSGELARLPSPVLLHPVAFTAGGHDANDPDFLPPDPRFGTVADFAAMVAAAHARGDLVMPYLNLSWWDPASPTLRDLPPPLQTSDVAVLDDAGAPVSIAYGDHMGVIVSPYSPYVQQRGAEELQRWQTDVPADCVFLDQLGARPWLRDFNPASPDPISYDDGWLAFLDRHRDRCVSVEDGWDRLARDATAFNGSLLMMSRQADLGNSFFGSGNWQPYPLADWLFHDKVLIYQHDLYPGTMTADPEVLLWNMAFGYVNSFSWEGEATIGSPWLTLAARLQEDLGPHYVGVPLTTYRSVAANVTDSVFGELDVLANWSDDTAFDANGDSIAPQGFLARTSDGAVVAGAFSGAFNGAALTRGVHYLVVERSGSSATVRQPVGGDTDVAVTAPANAVVSALAANGSVLGIVPGSMSGGRFVFHYAASLGGRDVAAYRVVGG